MALNFIKLALIGGLGAATGYYSTIRISELNKILGTELLDVA